MLLAGGEPKKRIEKEKSRANPYDDTPAAIPGRLQI